MNGLESSVFPSMKTLSTTISDDHQYRRRQRHPFHCDSCDRTVRRATATTRKFFSGSTLCIISSLLTFVYIGLWCVGVSDSSILLSHCFCHPSLPPPSQLGSGCEGDSHTCSQLLIDNKYNRIL